MIPKTNPNMALPTQRHKDAALVVYKHYSKELKNMKRSDVEMVLWTMEQLQNLHEALCRNGVEISVKS